MIMDRNHWLLVVQAESSGLSVWRNVYIDKSLRLIWRLQSTSDTRLGFIGQFLEHVDGTILFETTIRSCIMAG